MTESLDDSFSNLPFGKYESRYSSRKFPLHALTILSGHCRETSPAYYYDNRTRDISSHAAWQYTLSGRGCIDLKDGPRELLPGSLMVISIPGPHKYFLPESSGHWEFVFLTMMGREALRITRMIEQRLGNVLSAGGMPKTMGFLYEILEKLFSGEINNPFNNSSYTYQLCMQLLEEADVPHGESGNSFEKLKIFFKDNIHRDISVDEMAGVMGLSRSHFTRLFGKEMGMSPRMYLEDLRLRKALDMLFEKTITIKETAARCGIGDVNYFCRLFKKRYGISPGKYKEKYFPASVRINA
ncbi:AraC family transcriptional regulator [Spirochaetia bacterium]|nr:AraC family transcriptional regulator [Spirochaetia bacterium]